MKARHRFLDFSGFAPDPAPDTLPSGAISYGENIVQTLEGWEKTLGNSESGLEVKNEPRHIFFAAEKAAGDRWFVATGAKIESFQGVSWSDVTRTSADYDASAEWDWNSVNFNGVPIMNNGVDAPQYFAPSYKFEDFADIDTNVRFRVVRKFKNYLIGLGVKLTSEFEDSKIYWSHPADPGFMPASWDYTDPASDSGIFELSSAGRILDSLELGDVNIIYKTDSIWVMRFIGGQYIFSFEKKFAGQGLLTTGCVTEFEGKHFVVTQTDIILHDGRQLKSIAEDRVKEFFLESLSSEYYNRSFVVKRTETSDIWVMYPSKESEGYIDSILCWNWRDDVWSFRKVNEFIHAASGYGVPKSKESWDDMVNTWESDSPWQKGSDARNFSPTVHIASKNSSFLLIPDTNVLNFTEEVVSIWERKDIRIGPISRDGVVYQDYESEKIISSITFHVSSGSPFDVSLGFRESLDEPVEWIDYGEVNPTESNRLDLMETCGFLSIHIKAAGDSFVIRGIVIEYEIAGELW